MTSLVAVALVAALAGALIGWALRRSLRDSFARAALPFFLSVELTEIDVTKIRDGETTGDWIGRRCYEIADAMMKARSA